MKKILFILPSLGVGGMERMQVTIANVLARIGYDITVMTFDEGEDLASELLPQIRFVHKLPKYRLLKQIPKIKYLFDDGLWETRASATALHRYYVGKDKYDVEIAFFRGRSVKTISGALDRKVKRIAWVHSDFRHAGGVTANFHSIEETRDAYRQFNHVVCVSNQAMEGFKEVVGDTGNLLMIYNMVPGDEIKAKAILEPEVKVKKASFHIVIVGRLNDGIKGQTRLIHAVSQLHEEGYNISLAIVGSGQDEDKIREYIAKRNASEYISMTGNQSNPYPYMKEADLLVCASFFEGFNLTVVEALILGTPVLSTDCTGPHEILGDGKFGLLVENSTEGIYCGIEQLLNDNQLLLEYRQKANERAGYFDLKTSINQIVDVIEV